MPKFLLIYAKITPYLAKITPYLTLQVIEYQAVNLAENSAQNML